MENFFVVDNSVVMAWCFKEEKSKYADTVLEKLTNSTAIVPSIWPLEVVNVLLVAERRGRLEREESISFLELISELPINVERDFPEKDMKDLLSLGRLSNLSSYDCAYLLLALNRKISLATQDKKLVVAAETAGVEIVV